jgi:hypothetical protein
MAEDDLGDQYRQRLFLIWIIAGTSDRPSKDCKADAILSKSDCIAASDAGTAIGVGLIIFLWFLVFVVLSIIWFMTRPKQRTCPACGNDVKKGLTQCATCGHNFATAPMAIAPPPPA